MHGSLNNRKVGGLNGPFGDWKWYRCSATVQCARLLPYLQKKQCFLLVPNSYACPVSGLGFDKAMQSHRLHVITVHIESKKRIAMRKVGGNVQSTSVSWGKYGSGVVIVSLILIESRNYCFASVVWSLWETCALWDSCLCHTSIVCVNFTKLDWKRRRQK